MDCKNLSKNEENLCEEKYCYSKGSIDKTDDSCICNEFCIGENCDGPNSWKFTCDEHTGVGSLTDEKCNICNDCVCSSSKDKYISPNKVGSISKSSSNSKNIPTFGDNSKLDGKKIITNTPNTLKLNDDIILTPDSTYIKPMPTNVIKPLPFESTVVLSPVPMQSLSTLILPDNYIKDTKELISLKDYSRIFKFILRKLKPQKGSRESINYLYQKYSDWFKKFYSDQTIESNNEFNLIFYKLFNDFEGTYVLDIKYDNFKIISIQDNRLISSLNLIEKNLHLVNYINNNLELKENNNTSFNNIYLDYSDWIIKNKIKDKISSYELKSFLIIFFEKTSNNKFINLNIKNTSSENQINKQYEILNLFFKSNIENSEDNNLLLEEVYNIFVLWYSEIYPDKILIPQTVVLSYLQNNYTEISSNIFSNLKLKDSNLNSNLIKNNIIKNYFEDKIVSDSNGNLNFNDIYNNLKIYVEKFYPNYKIPNILFIKNQLNKNFTKNKSGNFKINFKKKLIKKKKKKGIFRYIPKWLLIILVIIILILILYFIYIAINNKPIDHFKGTFLYKNFLPDFESRS